MGGINAGRVLVSKTEGSRSPERPSLRWERNSSFIFKKMMRQGVDWINMAKDRDRWQDVVK